MSNFSDNTLNSIDSSRFKQLFNRNSTSTARPDQSFVASSPQQARTPEETAKTAQTRQGEQAKAQEGADPSKPQMAGRKAADSVRFTPEMNQQLKDERQKAIKLRNFRDGLETKFNSFLRVEPSMEEIRQAAKHASSTIWDILKKRLKEDDDEEISAHFLGLLMKIHSEYTFEHSERVMEWAVELGMELGIDDEQELNNLGKAAFFKDIGMIGEAFAEIDPEARGKIGDFMGGVEQYLRDCGSLHDIGKMLIPTEIIEKTAPLNDEEFEIIKTHPIIGVEIIRPYPHLHQAIPGIRHHHEKYDGRGYPDGLKGEEIPLAARIITVTDSFDAMVEDRPYRKALTYNDALNELINLAGRQFDPKLVFPFIRVLIRRGQVKLDELDLNIEISRILKDDNQKENAIDILDNLLEHLEDFVGGDKNTQYTDIEDLLYMG